MSGLVQQTPLPHHKRQRPRSGQPHAAGKSREDTGGNLSFALALLDADDNGYFEAFQINGFARKFAITAKTIDKASLQIELEEV